MREVIFGGTSVPPKNTETGSNYRINEDSENTKTFIESTCIRSLNGARMKQHTFQILFISTNKSIVALCSLCYTLTICVHNTILSNYDYVSSIKTNRTKK